MSQHNALQSILTTYEAIAASIQNNFSHLLKPISQPPRPLEPVAAKTRDGSTDLVAVERLESTSSSSKIVKAKSAVPLTKEELGRATWTVLHAIAAQYPDHPTRQQKRDVKELMAIISRLYPCKDCQDHFKEILKTNPILAGSHDEFSSWLCHVHNTVNRSIGKPSFPCQRVDARWGKLDCLDRLCDVEGGSDIP